MQINPDEITSILKARIEGLDAESVSLTEVGTVLSVADGICRVHGLENAMSFEMLELPHDVVGLARMLSGADAHFENFLNLLIEKHRMPLAFRIRAAFDELWEAEHRQLAVSVTSAVDLDERTVEEIGARIGEQTGRSVTLTSVVDPSIIGGVVLRVGNSILDASIRNRLELLRKQVARG